MGYLYSIKTYPGVREEEYSLIKKENILKATQWPLTDVGITIKQCKNTALSFINLHHLSNEEFYRYLNTYSFTEHNIFEVEKDSKPARFLDFFISKYGRHHKGNYITDDKVHSLNNYKLIKKYVYKYKWKLPESIAGVFLFHLFRLKQIPNLKDLELLNYNGEFLEWEMNYYKLKNKDR